MQDINELEEALPSIKQLKSTPAQPIETKPSTSAFAKKNEELQTTSVKEARYAI